MGLRGANTHSHSGRLADLWMTQTRCWTSEGLWWERAGTLGAIERAPHLQTANCHYCTTLIKWWGQVGTERQVPRITREIFRHVELYAVDAQFNHHWFQQDNDELQHSYFLDQCYCVSVHESLAWRWHFDWTSCDAAGVGRGIWYKCSKTPTQCKKTN